MNRPNPRIILALIGPAIAAIAFYCFHYAPYAKLDAIANVAFDPIYDLRPVVVSPKSESFRVMFPEESLLSDENASLILSLNQVPADYDLSLWIETNAITDVSLPVLSQLETTDKIVLGDVGISQSGIDKLAAALPGVLLCDEQGETLRPTPTAPSNAADQVR